MINNYGYIYNGNYVNQRKNGITKIGMTTVAPSQRRANIEKYSGHKFRMRKYIAIKDITKEDLLFVESWVRRAMANTDAQSNDHFTFTIESGRKEEQFDLLAECTMKYAVQALQFMGYDESSYKIKKCK